MESGLHDRVGGAYYYCGQLTMKAASEWNNIPGQGLVTLVSSEVW